MTTGMAFDNSKTMIHKFTYKEFTLILGIAVALIIVFTLWIRQPEGKISTNENKRSSVGESVEVLRFEVLKLRELSRHFALKN